MGKTINWLKYRANKKSKKNKKKKIEKLFFNLTNNAALGKTIAYVRNHEDSNHKLQQPKE